MRSGAFPLQQLARRGDVPTSTRIKFLEDLPLSTASTANRLRAYSGGRRVEQSIKGETTSADAMPRRGHAHGGSPPSSSATRWLKLVLLLPCPCWLAASTCVALEPARAVVLARRRALARTSVNFGTSQLPLVPDRRARSTARSSAHARLRGDHDGRRPVLAFPLAYYLTRWPARARARCSCWHCAVFSSLIRAALHRAFDPRHAASCTRCSRGGADVQIGFTGARPWRSPSLLLAAIMILAGLQGARAPSPSADRASRDSLPKAARRFAHGRSCARVPGIVGGLDLHVLAPLGDFITPTIVGGDTTSDGSVVYATSASPTTRPSRRVRTVPLAIMAV